MSVEYEDFEDFLDDDYDVYEEEEDVGPVLNFAAQNTDAGDEEAEAAAFLAEVTGDVLTRPRPRSRYRSRSRSRSASVASDDDSDIGGLFDLMDDEDEVDDEATAYVMMQEARKGKKGRKGDVRVKRYQKDVVIGPGRQQRFQIHRDVGKVDLIGKRVIVLDHPTYGGNIALVVGTKGDKLRLEIEGLAKKIFVDADNVDVLEAERAYGDYMGEVDDTATLIEVPKKKTGFKKKKQVKTIPIDAPTYTPLRRRQELYKGKKRTGAPRIVEVEEVDYLRGVDRTKKRVPAGVEDSDIYDLGVADIAEESGIKDALTQIVGKGAAVKRTAVVKNQVREQVFEDPNISKRVVKMVEGPFGEMTYAKTQLKTRGLGKTPPKRSPTKIRFTHPKKAQIGTAINPDLILASKVDDFKQFREAALSYLIDVIRTNINYNPEALKRSPSPKKYSPEIVKKMTYKQLFDKELGMWFYSTYQKPFYDEYERVRKMQVDAAIKEMLREDDAKRYNREMARFRSIYGADVFDLTYGEAIARIEGERRIDRTTGRAYRFNARGEQLPDLSRLDAAILYTLQQTRNRQGAGESIDMQEITDVIYDDIIRFREYITIEEGNREFSQLMERYGADFFTLDGQTAARRIHNDRGKSAVALNIALALEGRPNIRGDAFQIVVTEVINDTYKRMKDTERQAQFAQGFYEKFEKGPNEPTKAQIKDFKEQYEADLKKEYEQYSKDYDEDRLLKELLKKQAKKVRGPPVKDPAPALKKFEEKIYAWYHDRNTYAYLTNLLIPLVYFDQRSRIGRTAEFLHDKATANKVDFADLEYMNLAKFYPELGAAIVKGKVGKQKLKRFNDMFVELILYHIRFVVLSYIAVKHPGVRFTTPKFPDSTLRTGDIKGYTEEFLETTEQICGRKVSNKDLVLCLDPDTKEFTCHERKKVETAIKTGKPNPITGKPWPKGFVERMKR